MPPPRHRIETEIVVPRGLDEVFAFFSDAHNLDELTPPWLRFHVLTPRPVPMHVGARIDYRLRIRGLPIRWQSEITAWEPPWRFVDEQRRGPYRLWHHEHLFESVPGGTRIVDRVDYAVAGWVLEPLVHRVFVRPDVERIFRYRGERLAERFARPSAA